MNGVQSLGNEPLLRAVERHFGVVVTGDDPPPRLADQVAKGANMRQSAGSADSRVGALIWNPGNVLVQKPQPEALYYTNRGRICTREVRENSPVACRMVKPDRVAKSRGVETPVRLLVRREPGESASNHDQSPGRLGAGGN